MKRVVIIGAGPAGLTAAYELTHGPDAGEYEVVVLEESDAIGGISRTIRYNGNRMDIGGHRFFSKDEEILRWWNEILPLQGAPAYDDRKLGRGKRIRRGGPDPEKEDNVMLMRRRVSRIYYRRKFFDYPVSLKPETIRNMGVLTSARVLLSYMRASIFQKKVTSLEDFFINRFGRVLYGMFFEGYTEKVWGKHPREISAAWGAQRVKGLSVKETIRDMSRKMLGRKSSGRIETSLIEKFRYPKCGPGQLWELVAERITEAGGKIVFGARVDRIEVKAEGAAESGEAGTMRGETAVGNCRKEGEAGAGKSVTRVIAGDRVYEADCVISSMPVKDLARCLRVDIPPKVAKIAERLPYRDFVTVGLLVRRLELKNRTNIKTLGNIVPDCWIYVQDSSVKVGRIQIFNNWSPYLVRDPDNTVWIGLEYFCAEGDDFWQMSDEARIHFAVKELVHMGIIRSDAVLDSCCEKVRKAYPAYYGAYAHFPKVRAYLDSIDNLYCVGRNGQHRYNNMDHSMATALRAVECIRNGGAGRAAVWEVNMEQNS